MIESGKIATMLTNYYETRAVLTPSLPLNAITSLTLKVVNGKDQEGDDGLYMYVGVTKASIADNKDIFLGKLSNDWSYHLWNGSKLNAN